MQMKGKRKTNLEGNQQPQLLPALGGEAIHPKDSGTGNLVRKI